MLNELIKINSVYARSINIERDESKIDLLNSYIPTSVALQTIKKVTDTFDIGKQLNRSWTSLGHMVQEIFVWFVSIRSFF